MPKDIVDKLATLRPDDYPMAGEAIKEIQRLRDRVNGLLESNNRLVEERRAAQAESAAFSHKLTAFTSNLRAYFLLYQTDQPQATDPVPVLDLISRAMQTVFDLCHQRKRWVMSIPARPDEDPDLIIGEALRKARGEIVHLTAALKAVGYEEKAIIS